jgi:hypothetical protein
MCDKQAHYVTINRWLQIVKTNLDKNTNAFLHLVARKKCLKTGEDVMPREQKCVTAAGPKRTLIAMDKVLSYYFSLSR